MCFAREGEAPEILQHYLNVGEFLQNRNRFIVIDLCYRNIVSRKFGGNTDWLGEGIDLHAPMVATALCELLIFQS